MHEYFTFNMALDVFQEVCLLQFVD